MATGKTTQLGVSSIPLVIVGPGLNAGQFEAILTTLALAPSIALATSMAYVTLGLPHTK